MAKDNDNSPIKFGQLRKMASRVQSTSDSIYKSTYYADPENKRQLDFLKTDITSSIKDIVNSNSDNAGDPNISKLYERLLMRQNDGDTISEFEKIFGDNDFVNNLTNSYLDNRWVKSFDTEIDECIRYMPKLQEALDTIRDNVLSADSFSKDFLNMEPPLGGTTSVEQFSRNIEDFKDSYNLNRFITEIYDDASKYGEVFVYCVPYEKAIQRLISRKTINNNIVVKTNYTEGSVIIESEGYSDSLTIDENYSSTESNGIDYDIEIDNSGIISSIVEAEYSAKQKLSMVVEQSISEQYLLELDQISINNDGGTVRFNRITDNDIEAGTKLPVHHRFDSTLSDNLELPGNDTTNDGLIVNRNENKKIKSMTGCIIKKLKRERVTPIILNDICLGYYYFEYDQNQELFENRFTTTGMVNTITGLRSNGRSEAFDSVQRREELLRSIATQLAAKIDTKFVDNNQELKKEIYYILKYNDDFNSAAGSNNIRVTYIPPEDIHHIYFNLDEDTGRGISDLNLSLIPAKLWVAIYITNCLAVMTRGNDKRVYYVRQSVESNISKTLLKTINEIKKSNFGIRQIENINSVLNITGRFNDYIIPRGSDGQSPVEFEVMQGQQIEIKTELLNLLEESAINVTGVPIEIIQNRQSPDYAIQLTMSNSKFLRFVYQRQSDFQRQISKLITKIYDIEYGVRDKITVNLPPPLFINITNTNQLIMNTNDYCENIANIYMANEQDETIKQRFAKELKIYYLGSYLNNNIIKDLCNKARQETTVDIVSNPENLDSGG